jgi:RNA recognition motif-containing protein
MDDGRRLYIGNLAYEATERELRDAFAIYVGVEKVEILKDRESGMSRGFGFVTLVMSSDADTAIEKVNGVEVRGRKLRVAVANPRGNGRW